MPIFGLCISGQFRLSGNHFSASYEASEFCWQIRLNFPQHLRPCHILSCINWHFSSPHISQKSWNSLIFDVVVETMLTLALMLVLKLILMLMFELMLMMALVLVFMVILMLVLIRVAEVGNLLASEKVAIQFSSDAYLLFSRQMCCFCAWLHI